MSAPVRAMTFGAPFSLCLVTTCTGSERPSRRAPRAMASFGFSRSIKVPRSDAAVRCILHADPRAIRQALPSLLIEPSGSNEIRFVSGPLNLAKRVISLAITTHLRRSRAPVIDPDPARLASAGSPCGLIQQPLGGALSACRQICMQTAKVNRLGAVTASNARSVEKSCWKGQLRLVLFP